jgi:hypothetical protein
MYWAAAIGPVAHLVSSPAKFGAERSAAGAECRQPSISQILWTFQVLTLLRTELD